jgi:hypothetical protein
MIELKRLTTQYDPAEDRIRLTGTDDEGQTLCLWLTQRLINLLVPHLCQGLEKQASASAAEGMAQPLRSHVEQSFAQQRARAAQRRQAPVVAADGAPQWRVDVLDIKRAPGGVRLVFKGKLEAEQAVVDLPASALRQWLGIVFDQYRRASWPTQAWPAWMEEAAMPAVQASASALH